MKTSKGFTLVEVIVAVLITAVMVSSVFSISLSSRRGNLRADHKLIAAQATRQLSATLQNYVTADNTVATSIGGQAGFQAPGGTWQFPGDSVGYALEPGSHTATGYLPGWFEAAPYNARAMWFVSCTGTCPPDPSAGAPWISVAVTWDEP
jgi:prepilin-type N-terminal cleavage/methylation domain-containing protein